MKKSSRKKEQKKDSLWYDSKELKPEVSDCPKNIVAIVNTRTANQQDLFTLKAGLDVEITTDASGVYSLVQSDNPSGVANWSSFSSVWDEYRVLAVRVLFKPHTMVGGASAITFAPIITVLDYDNAAVLTGYTLASQYSSQKEFPGNRSWKRTIYMSGSENADFTSTASVVSTKYIKGYSSGNSASLKLGRLHIEFFIQFRGLGI
jgi:hypothetical protein